MKKKVIFYHAGCPVCKTAEDAVLELIDKSKYDLEVVHYYYSINLRDLFNKSYIKSE